MSVDQKDGTCSCESTQERAKLNKQLAQMLKGGVIMDVTTPEQARIAEEAGACAVMALERIPADIRLAGGVSRMSDPKMIKGIQKVSIRSWRNAASDISRKRRSSKRSTSTTSTNRKCSRQQMIPIISIKRSSALPSYAAHAIWERRFVALPKVPQ